MRSHWAVYQERWSRLAPPLRPNAEVVTAIGAALSSHRGPTLLLGVTPELADVGPEVLAVDRSRGMIDGVWPGDTATRRAVEGDWLDLPVPAATFRAAVGDGSLNALAYPEGHRALHAELARVLAPGGRAVLRAFRRPDDPETLAEALQAALAREIDNFHAFKWRWTMALVAEGGTPNVAVRAIRDSFVGLVPDRAAFAARTGWARADIDTIDVYEGSGEVYSFPTQAELVAVIPPEFGPPETVAAGSYPLADRCPLVVLDRRREPRRAAAPP